MFPIILFGELSYQTEKDGAHRPRLLLGCFEWIHLHLHGGALGNRLQRLLELLCLLACLKAQIKGTFLGARVGHGLIWAIGKWIV